MFTYKGSAQSTQTTLNEIPNGTVFYGRVKSASATSDTYVEGVFLKVANPGSYASFPSHPTAICLTVANLHAEVYGAPKWWATCEPVLDYRPLKNPQIIEG